MKAFRFETRRFSMSRPESVRSGHWLETLYTHLLLLYPRRFRHAHGEPMLQTLRDALSDSTVHQPSLFFHLLTDLLQSVVKERYAMLQETLGRRIFLFHSAMLAILCTVLALGICASVQQVQRQDANDPQIQMVRDAASLLEQGSTLEAALPPSHVDASSSLSAFLIIYDDAGKPVASSMSLEGKSPAPPPGVFDYTRQHAEDWITWQPRRGVRFASIVKHVAGPHPGFVLAGRSLQEVEARKDIVGKIVLAAWAATMALLVAGTGAFAWMTKRSETNGAT
jgi:hypothetical protein